MPYVHVDTIHKLQIFFLFNFTDLISQISEELEKMNEVLCYIHSLPNLNLILIICFYQTMSTQVPFLAF